MLFNIYHTNMITIASVRRFIGIVAVFILSAATLHARAQIEEPAPRESDIADIIINDPEVRYGVLDNGLTYYVRRNEKPAGIAELRLAIHAGSLQEDEDQLGLAHFLEHMLFNGTEKYPKNELTKKLESFGVEFGPDLNAYTGFTDTLYQLTVSSVDEEEFNAGLDVLKEWAFHALLDEEEYEKERAVVYEEWRRSQGAMDRVMNQMYPILLKGSRYADRLPIGNMDVVLNAPISALKRFYRDWYRPDLMAVIAVGDFDPDATVKKIADLFGNQPNPARARAWSGYSIPRHSETYRHIIDDPEMGQSNVQIYVKYDTPRINNRIDYKSSFVENLFSSILNKRLTKLRLSEDPPFLHGAGYTFNFTNKTSFASLYAEVNEDEALRGLEALLSEVERIRLHGFLPAELERAKIEILSSYENEWKQHDDMDSAYLIPHYVNAFTKGTPYPSIDWQWKTAQELLPLINIEQVNEFASVLLSDMNRAMFVLGPSEPIITDITPKDIDWIIQNVKNMKLEAWEEEPALGPLVETPPQPGKIVSRNIVPETDIVQLTLSNGATVFYKVTDFTADEVIFRAFSLGGASLVDDDQYVSAELATRLVSIGGLGNFSLTELDKILTGIEVEVNPYISEEFEGMNGSCTTEDLESLFQLIYLRHSMPRRDETALDSLLNNLSADLKNRDLDPMTPYYDALTNTIYGGHYRMQPITIERLSELNLDDAFSIYSERFRHGGDFTYVFVGDFNPSSIESLSEKWLASLPASPVEEMWRDNNIRYFKDNADITVNAGSEPLSLVSQSWQGEWDGSPLERYKMESLAAALEMALLEAIREEDGGTYSIEVGLWAENIPVDEYFFGIQYSCAPERVDELSAHVIKVIDTWRSNSPEARYAESIAMAQRKNLKERLESNHWWSYIIQFALQTGTDPELLLNMVDIYDTLTPEMLQSTTVRYFDDDSYIRVIRNPKNEVSEN